METEEKGHDDMCYRTALLQEYSNLQLLWQIHRKRVELPGVPYIITFVLNFCFAWLRNMQAYVALSNENSMTVLLCLIRSSAFRKNYTANVDEKFKDDNRVVWTSDARSSGRPKFVRCRLIYSMWALRMDLAPFTHPVT